MQIQSPTPTSWQRLVQRLAATRPASAALLHLLPTLDRAVKALTGRTLTELLAGLPVVYLTSYGAISGKAHVCPLLGIPDGERLILIASNFGGRKHPAWYRNLRKNPESRVSFNGRTAAFRAHEAHGDERDRYWAQAVRLYPGFEAYARRANGRRIPVMVLTLAQSQYETAGEQGDGRQAQAGF